MFPLQATRRRGLPDRLSKLHLSAPTGGVNTISSGVDMPTTDAIWCYNAIGGEYGLRTRLGWREWCINLAGEEVRSILPFTGSTKSGGNNRLFAVTSSGIWNVSSSSSSPTKVVGSGDGWVSGTDAGWGASTVFVTSAGHFLCYCDEQNGYWVYTESTASWTAGGPSGSPITGVNPANLVFCVAWKNRIWFVERDTGKGWYLGLNAIGGAATSFNFGARFKAGGDLRGLWSWTQDGGSGIDDYLVAVSGGGDVLIYKGTDPSAASTFSLNGVWFVGAVPVGRRLCTDFGGDLLIMSSIGIMPLSKLVIGNLIYDRSQYQTFKIGNLFNQLQAATSTVRGWAMRLHPQDAALMVLIPVAANQASQQLVMSLQTRGWHQYRDMPIGVCAEPWNGTFYFGTADGRVCINDGYVDGVLLSNPNAYTPISWSLLTAYQNLGDPRLKRVPWIKPHLISQGGGDKYQAQALFDWDMTEPSPVTGGNPISGSAWDVALWDVAKWGGSYQYESSVFGSAGVGSTVAIAIRGRSASRTVLTGFDVAYELGGLR